MDIDERRTRTPDEAGRILGISRAGIYRAIRSGELRTIVVGRRRLVPLAAIDDLLSQSGRALGDDTTEASGSTGLAEDVARHRGS